MLRSPRSRWFVSLALTARTTKQFSSCILISSWKRKLLKAFPAVIVTAKNTITVNRRLSPPPWKVICGRSSDFELTYKLYFFHFYRECGLIDFIHQLFYFPTRGTRVCQKVRTRPETWISKTQHYGFTNAVLICANVQETYFRRVTSSLKFIDVRIS